MADETEEIVKLKMQIETEEEKVSMLKRRIDEYISTLAEAELTTVSMSEASAEMYDRIDRVTSAFGSNLGRLRSFTSVLNNQVIDAVMEFADQAANLAEVGGQLGRVFGPTGVVVGALSGALVPAVGAVVQAFDAQAEAMQAALERTAEYNHTLSDLIGLEGDAAEALRLRERIMSGEGSREEQGGAMARERQEIELIERALAGDSGAIQFLRRRRGDRRQVGIGERAAAAITDLSQGRALGTTMPGGMDEREIRLLEGMLHNAQTRMRERLTQFNDAVARDTEDRADAIVDSMTDVIETVADLAEARQEAFEALMLASPEHNIQDTLALVQEAIDEFDQRNQERADRERERAQEVSAERLRLIQLEHDKMNELADQARDAEQARRDEEKAKRERERDEAERQLDEMTSYSQQVVGLVTEAIGSIIDGTATAEEAFKGMLAGFLEMIAEQAVLSAAREFAEAIASFARQDYSGGGQHLAAGVAFTALAIAAGAGSAALTKPTAAAPQEGASFGQGSNAGGNTVVINWNSPVVTAGTEAALGRRLTGMIQRSAQVY